MLKRITLLRERVADWTTYPFSVPAIATLPDINLHARVTFFAGENGTGKSTLLEAIAAHIGFGREGGNRDLRFETSESSQVTEPLSRALRLSFDKRTGEGFYFRAESLFSLATQIDEWDKDPYGAGRIVDSYGGISLHNRSHGETFFTVLDNKFRRSGLFLLDEPEAALSPQRQLAFLILIRDTLNDYKDAQFIISTHALAYPPRLPRRTDPLLRRRHIARDRLRGHRSHADRPPFHQRSRTLSNRALRRNSLAVRQ